jgi:hypothetical protein
MSTSRENSKPVAWLAASVILLAFAIATTATAEPGSDQWTYSAEIYGWLPDIKTTTATGGDVDITQHDLIENIQMFFFASAAAYKGKWSLFADTVYFKISADGGLTESVPVLGPIELDVDIEADIAMKAFVGTLGGTYNVFDNDKATVNLIGGARYLWIKLDSKFDFSILLPRQEVDRKENETLSGDVWDGIVGVKGQINLNDKWYLPYYVDIGTGQSDLTWQTVAGVGYKFKWGDVLLTYRYLDYEFKSDYLLDDLAAKGPQVGAKFYF